MILVTGATGNVGSEVIGVLLDAGVPVRALVRDADRPVPPGAEVVVGDLNDPASFAGALPGCSGAFLLSGYEGMAELLGGLRDAGVERVVLLSGGAAAASDTDNAVSRYQIASEQAVRDSGIPWTILRPYAFAANALRWVPGLRAGDVVRVPFANVANAVSVTRPTDTPTGSPASMPAWASWRRRGPSRLARQARLSQTGSTSRRPSAVERSRFPRRQGCGRLAVPSSAAGGREVLPSGRCPLLSQDPRQPEVRERAVAAEPGDRSDLPAFQG